MQCGAHIDEQARILAGEVERTDKWDKYPHVLAHAVRWYRAVRPEPAVAADADLPAHLHRAGLPIRDVRIVVCALALLIVPGTWFLARTWLSPGWSLVAL